MTKIFDPTEEEMKALESVVIKASDYKSGILFNYDENKKLSCCIYGSPRQLACLYLEIQDRLPEGVVEYANMIRNNAENDSELESMEIQTPVNKRIYN